MPSCCKPCPGERQLLRRRLRWHSERRIGAPERKNPRLLRDRGKREEFFCDSFNLNSILRHCKIRQDSGSIPRPPRRGTGTWLQRAAKPLKIPIAGQTHTVAKRFQLSETGRQTRCCQRQLPMCFGRIALQVKPYSSVSPSRLSSPTGATRVGRPRGSPFRLPLLRNVAPLSQQDG